MSSGINFSTLISPYEPREFFSCYWERAPLAISGGEPTRDLALLCRIDLDYVLQTACLSQPESIDVIEEKGNARQALQIDQLDTLSGALQSGSWIRTKGVGRYSQPFNDLCRNLEQEFSFPVRANLYCTPPNSKGFQLHFDTHEIFVLQLSGAKRWRVFEPCAKQPLAYVPPLPFEENRDELKYYRGGVKKSQGDINQEGGGALGRPCVCGPGPVSP